MKDKTFTQGSDQAKKMVYLANTNANMKERLQEREETWTLTNNKADFGVVEEPKIKQLNQGEKQGYCVYNPEGIGPTLVSSNADGRKAGLIKLPKEEPRMKDLTKGQMQGYRVYDPTGINQTLQANCGGVGAKTGLTIDQCRIRRLTPRECERLQGFLDDWTLGCSDTQRYKQCGNAIMVDMAYEVAKHLE